MARTHEKKKRETLAFLESRCSTFIHITFRCGRIRPAAPLVAFTPGAKGTAAHSAVQGKRLAIRTIGDFKIAALPEETVGSFQDKAYCGSSV